MATRNVKEVLIRMAEGLTDDCVSIPHVIILREK